MKLPAITCLCLAFAFLTGCTPSVIKLSANKANEELAAMPRQDWHFSKSARSKIRKAYQIHQFEPRLAAALFLHAAYELEPHQNGSDWAKNAYQHALGMGIQLAQNNKYWGETLATKGFSITLAEDLDHSALSNSEVDELHFSGSFRTPSLTPDIEVQGSGTPMVAKTHFSEAAKQAHPFISETGYLQAKTLVAEWSEITSQGARLRVRLLDPRRNPGLAANYTAPVALYDLLTKELIYSGIHGVYRPTSGLERMGLYNSAPMDPERTPIIFVHGLAASPNLWLKPIHELLRNPRFREKYQIYVFYYPTGFPVPQNANNLKKELKRLQTLRLKVDPNPPKMVIVGHSMGGLLTSVVTRDFSGEYDKLYNVRLQNLEVADMAKETIEGILQEPPIDFVSKAIFLGTPHRGSPYANNWIGRSTSHLISIPKTFLSIDPSSYQHDFSSFGKSIWDINQDLDGIRHLETDHPMLLYTLDRPKIDGVQYYSVIGDRGWGGELSESSDGLVPYKSATLDNDESELIVPAWHNLQDHPETIAEILRVLDLD